MATGEVHFMAMAMTVDEILEHVRALPPREQLELAERVTHELGNESGKGPARSPIGLFEDEPELIDAVSEDAMHARERDKLRADHG